MRKLSRPAFARLREKTCLALAGRDPTNGLVNPPIVRGSTVVYPNTEDFLIRKARYIYGTQGNPTICVPIGLTDCEAPKEDRDAGFVRFGAAR